MNRSMETAARRHLAALEARVTQQGALVDGLVASNRDTNAAMRFVLRDEPSAEPKPA